MADGTAPRPLSEVVEEYKLRESIDSDVERQINALEEVDSKAKDNIGEPVLVVRTERTSFTSHGPRTVVEEHQDIGILSGELMWNGHLLVPTENYVTRAGSHDWRSQEGPMKYFDMRGLGIKLEGLAFFGSGYGGGEILGPSSGLEIKFGDKAAEEFAGSTVVSRLSELDPKYAEALYILGAMAPIEFQAAYFNSLSGFDGRDVERFIRAQANLDDIGDARAELLRVGGGREGNRGLDKVYSALDRDENTQVRSIKDVVARARTAGLLEKPSLLYNLGGGEPLDLPAAIRKVAQKYEIFV